MERHKILEILAEYYGLIPEYTDKEGKTQKVSSRECQEFLNIIGINTESMDMLAEELQRTELEKWNRIIPPVKIIKHGEAPVVTLRLPDFELNKSFEWVLQEEGGRFHHGEFYASHLKISESRTINGTTFYKIDLPVPILVGTGYHNLKIRSETGKEDLMKLIIVPKKCYKPLAVEQKKKIKGLKFSLYRDNFESDYRISDYTDLKNAVIYAKDREAGIVGVDSLNQFHFYNGETDPEIPSSRIMYNSILIDIDEAINFVEDREIKLKLLTEEFQEELKKVQESETLNYKAVYELKLRVLRLIYNSFRENHINKQSEKSRDFFHYLSAKEDNLRKLALFEAIKEYLSGEDPKLADWHEWPEMYRNPNSEAVLLFENQNIETLQFYEFLQWLADIQLSLAGKTSWVSKLSVGIYSQWQFFVNSDSAETWLRQEYYAFKAKTLTKQITEDYPDCPPILPFKLKEHGYKYVSEALSTDMTHSGAIRIKNIHNFEKQLWRSKQNPDINFCVKYPAEELIGILALESHRNKCLIIPDEAGEISFPTREILENYGFLYETDFDIEEITKAETPAFFESINLIQKQKDESPGYGRRIELERTPLSVYRLQFNKNFTFKDAQEIVPYLKDLGISHCYASPLLRARKGSPHGYDIINHSELNPEIGTLNDFHEFVNTLYHHDMGLIIDIVPNHMGVGKENRWWMDVLENGQASVYASFFDIDWHPLKKELEGKVLVPVLGDHYGNILQSGQLKFHFVRETGKLKLSYWDHEFPINPSSYPIFLEHRIEVLESRLGSNNPDFLEYLSIITELKKIPGINEASPEKTAERNREKDIASRRLSALCNHNLVIEGFIQENIIDFEGKPNDPVSCNRIHSLLEEQAYRLAYWRVSTDIINYRRFFDINDLICLRAENPLVFTSTHSLILDLIEQEKIDGLRIDHPDGLLDPGEYFKKLQAEAGKRLGIRYDLSEEEPLGSDKLPIYVVAEKILAPFEKLPENWAVSGTVGYEFLNQVCNLFVDKRNSRKFSRIYQRFIGKSENFSELITESKKLIMKTSLTGELSTLSNYLNRISEKYYSTRDYTLNSLRDALTEIIACFPIYRTYISGENCSGKAVNYIKWAIGLAKKRTMHTDPSIFDFIESILLAELEEDKNSPAYQDILDFAMKFQQYTAPLMAKGLEDTSFYRFNKLIALNEVGGEPSHFGISTNDFHNENIKRLDRTPHGFLTTSTHDTKRSEDVRMRICVLSEIPEKWMVKVNRFSRLNKSRKPKIENILTPDRNDEYLFYQTLIGIWSYKTPDENEKEELIQILENYMIKALREAKVHTSWVNINEQYEKATCEFIRKILSSPENHPFWREFLPFQKEIARAGFLNSIFQCALKLTCPGVPDIYQGSELYKFALVDPDNRKPVNYVESGQKLEEIKHLINPDVPEEFNIQQEILPLESGKMKLFLTASILNFRQKHQDIFRRGNYLPLQTKGVRERNLVTFAREFEQEAVIVVVPRLIYNAISEESPIPLGENVWQDTGVILPDKYSNCIWKDILTAQEFESRESVLYAGKILNTLPVAVLYRKFN